MSELNGARSAMVGSLAPDFDLPCTSGPGREGRARLADYRGRWLMLVFYPRDFSLICPTELTAVSAKIDLFDREGCDVLGVSTDTIESHARWISQPPGRGGLGGLRFPLASDVECEISRTYGVFLDRQRVALRGLFIIDPNGVLQYQVVHNLSVGRRTEEMLRVLQALQTGGLCAEAWTREQATISVEDSIGPGSMVGVFRIEEKVGSGGFASVYRAWDTTLERPVALKVIRSASADTPAAILAEARAAAALNHPNVCTIYAVDDSEGVPIIAMEYVAGRTLATLVAEGPLAADEARRVARQVASGMAAAHAQGIVHGDLKPGNVFVTEDGTAKILDFGLARRHVPQIDPDATLDATKATGTMTGTPSYMAPEQINGQPATPASDVFSLAAIVFEMLTGRRAFPGATLIDVLGRILNVSPAHVAEPLDEPFRAIVQTSLARNASDRRLAMQDIADTLS